MAICASALAAVPITVCALLLAGAFRTGAAAQAVASNRLGLTPHHKLYDVAFADGARGWIVGSLGLVLATEDGGESWRRQVTDTRETLFSVSFTDEATGWISGTSGTILHTSDAGAHWRAQEAGTDAQLFAIAFANPRDGVAVGSFGALVRTSDGGRSWEPVKVAWASLLGRRIERAGYVEPHLYDVCFSDAARGGGWIVGEFGLILRTEDGGRGWSVQRSRTSGALSQVFFSGSRRGWVAGQDGLLLHTRDAGETWRHLATGVGESLFAVAARRDGALAVGQKGTILLSADGETGWARLPPGQAGLPGLLRGQARVHVWFHGIGRLPRDRFVVVGDRGTVVRLDLGKRRQTGPAG